MNPLKLCITAFLFHSSTINAFSTPSPKLDVVVENKNNRRSFLSKIGGIISTSAIVTSTTSVVLPTVASAEAPEIVKLSSGIKYAITKPVGAKAQYPQGGDLVLIEFTGYLTNGQVRMMIIMMILMIMIQREKEKEKRLKKNVINFQNQSTHFCVFFLRCSNVYIITTQQHVVLYTK